MIEIEKGRNVFYVLSFILLFLSSIYLGSCSYNSEKELRYLDFSDFPIVANIDSLENIINSADTTSKEYLHGLVHFEIINSIQKSFPSREKIDRILELVQSNGAFAEYKIIAKFLDANGWRRTNTYESFKQSLPVIEVFRAQKDTIGLYRILFLLSSLNMESQFFVKNGTDDSYGDYKKERQHILETSSDVYLRLNYYSSYFGDNYDSIQTRDPIDLGYQMLDDAADLISKNPKYEFMRVPILTNMSGFFEMKCDKDERDRLLYESLVLDTINPKASTFYNYSLCFTREFNYQLDSAIYYLEKANKVDPIYLSLRLRERIAKKLSKYYYELGDFEISRSYSITQDSLTALIYDSERERSILELETKYGLEKAEDEKEVLSRKISNLSFMGGLAALLILMLLYTIRRTSSFRKSEKEEMKFKESLNAIIVHDLKSPFIAMEHLVKPWPQNEIPTSVQNDLVKYIRGTNKLVDNLLVWSKIRMNKGILAFKNENVYNLIHEVVNDYELLIKSKNIEVISEIELTLNCSLRSDATKLIISNLISNAIKHSEASTIEIEAYKKLNKLIIRIADNGTGINKSKEENIRQILFTKNKNYRPSGLGFVIIENLLQMSKGEIEFNTDSKRTEFILTCEIK